MIIEKVNRDNFNLTSLDEFDRFQVVKNVYRRINGELKLVDNPFTEDWSAERRREKANEILNGGYVTYCAFDEGRVVGEIMLNPALNENRLIVDSFHVSRECRRKGIGRALFQKAIGEARERHANALYISACSAKETIDFYRAMGCRPTEHPIQAMAEDEPWDIQMEYKLNV